MSSTDTQYTARFSLPELIERGRDELIKCMVYLSGALVAPSSGTVTVRNASGDVVINAASATITGSVAQYTITAGTLNSQSLGEGWQVEWNLTMPDSVVHKFRNTAALVRGRLYMPIADADLIRVVSALDPTSSTSISSVANWQDYLDEAWVQIQLRLIEQGNRPNLILSPSALRETALSLTLALIFEDLSTRLSDAYEQRAESYRGRYEQAWARLRFTYDTDDDGQADTVKRPSMASVWLTSR